VLLIPLVIMSIGIVGLRRLTPRRPACMPRRGSGDGAADVDEVEASDIYVRHPHFKPGSPNSCELNKWFS